MPVAGALFLNAPDPFAAVAAVEIALRDGTTTDEQLVLTGVSPDLLQEYKTLLRCDPLDLPTLLNCGAAWATGLRASPARGSDAWRPVVSGAGLGPPDFPTRTGESLVQLIMSARNRLRFAPAYFDKLAAGYLGPSIAAATQRAVTVTILIVDQLEREEASAELSRIVADRGTVSELQVIRGTASDWFAHMKMLTADSRAAYVGSANSTITGLTTNFELGVVVTGDGVQIIDAFFDRVRDAIVGNSLDGDAYRPDAPFPT